MPTTSFLEYARAIRSAVDNLIDSGDAVLVSLQVDQRSAVRGFIEGSLQFRDGSQLVFREFLDVTRREPRLMYAYHYQDEARLLLFRYDNAKHRPVLPQTSHRHAPSGIESTFSPTLTEVLDEILEILDA
jgi:hypothetical protein